MARLTATLQMVSAKSDLAGAIRYALVRWPALTRYRDDGRIVAACEKMQARHLSITVAIVKESLVQNGAALEACAPQVSDLDCLAGLTRLRSDAHAHKHYRPGNPRNS